MKILLKRSCLLFFLNSLVLPIAIGQVTGSVTVRSIAQLRSLAPTDTATLYYLIQKGKEGNWRYDATDISSSDNTGTIVVTAGGKRLKRLISDGILQVNWFNVYADGENDDRPGIQKALDYYKKNANSITWLQFGNAQSQLVTYMLTDSLRIDFNADIRGGANTRLLFNKNHAGLKLRSSETKAFIPTIYLTGLNIQAVYSRETFNSNEMGIEMNCVAHLKDVTVSNFQGNGIEIWGNGGMVPPTSADLSTFDRVTVSLCRGNGFLIYGADANIINFKDCQAISCGGAGWLDNSFLGNNYINCQAASCSSPELAFQRGLCKYNGKVYYALHNANFKGAKNKLGRPDISPNDWDLAPEQAWIRFPFIKSWHADSTYLATGGFLLDLDNVGKNQRGALLNCYAEMDCMPSYWGTSCIKVGGNFSNIRDGLSMSSWLGMLDINTGVKVTNPITTQTTMQRSNAFAWLKKTNQLEGVVNLYDTASDALTWYDYSSYGPNGNVHAFGGNFLISTQSSPAPFFGRKAFDGASYFSPFARQLYLNNMTPGGYHFKKLAMSEKIPELSVTDMSGDIVLNAVTTPGNDILGWRKVGDGAKGVWEPMVLAGSNAANSAVNNLDVNNNKFRVRNAKTPSSSNDTGNTGDICWDAKYIYVCVATNKWVRTALSTW